jgi:hypothetical protein
VAITEFVRHDRETLVPMSEPKGPQSLRDLIDVGGCKSPSVRVRRDEVFVPGHHEVSPRPLEEQLCDQHAVRLGSVAPGKLAAMVVEPAEDASAKPPAVDWVDIVVTLPALSATHERILALLKERVGQDVPGHDIYEVAGIHEWARRVRELRVEHGYRITRVRAGQNSVYRLEDVEPDTAAADRWRVMNQIRRDPEHGARERILTFLRENVGQPVNMDELRYVANVHEVGRRVRELRVEHGYIITSHMDRSGLRPGDYVLESLEPLPANERITAEQRTRILGRDGYRCQLCGWGIGDPPSHGKRFVEVHHITPVNQGGGSEDENLETLCNVCHDAIPV